MISTKCDKCKNKALCWSCNECQSKPFQCFVSNETITYRERHDHLQTHLINPNQYLVCRMCKVKKTHLFNNSLKEYKRSLKLILI